MYNRGRLDEKPKKRKTAVMLTRVLRAITEVTWKGSMRRPTMVALGTEHVFGKGSGVRRG
jgi:hypothetical protein